MTPAVGEAEDNHEYTTKAETTGKKGKQRKEKILRHEKTSELRCLGGLPS